MEKIYEDKVHRIMPKKSENVANEFELENLVVFCNENKDEVEKFARAMYQVMVSYEDKIEKAKIVVDAYCYLMSAIEHQAGMINSYFDMIIFLLESNDDAYTPYGLWAIDSLLSNKKFVHKHLCCKSNNIDNITEGSETCFEEHECENLELKAEYLEPLSKVINIFKDLSNKGDYKIYGLNGLKTVVDKTISFFYRNKRALDMIGTLLSNLEPQSGVLKADITPISTNEFQTADAAAQQALSKIIKYTPDYFFLEIINKILSCIKEHDWWMNDKERVEHIFKIVMHEIDEVKKRKVLLEIIAYGSGNLKSDEFNKIFDIFNSVCEHIEKRAFGGLYEKVIKDLYRLLENRKPEEEDSRAVLVKCFKTLSKKVNESRSLVKFFINRLCEKLDKHDEEKSDRRLFPTCVLKLCLHITENLHRIDDPQFLLGCAKPLNCKERSILYEIAIKMFGNDFNAEKLRKPWPLDKNLQTDGSEKIHVDQIKLYQPEIF